MASTFDLNLTQPFLTKERVDPKDQDDHSIVFKHLILYMNATPSKTFVLVLFLHSKVLVLDYRSASSIFVALSAKFEFHTIFMGIAYNSPKFTSISLHLSNLISINSV